MVSVAIWACQKSVASCLRTLPNARIAIWGAPPGSASYHGWQDKGVSLLKLGGTLQKAFLAVDASVASEITTHLYVLRAAERDGLSENSSYGGLECRIWGSSRYLWRL